MPDHIDVKFAIDEEAAYKAGMNQNIFGKDVPGPAMVYLMATVETSECHAEIHLPIALRQA